MPGKYTYKYGSYVDIQLTDEDANANKALTEYGNPSNGTTVDTDRLVVEDGWNTGATGWIGNLSMNYKYSITNCTINNLNTIYSYLSDGTLYLTNDMNNMGKNGSAEAGIGGNVTKFVIYSGTASRTISITDENWLEVDATNFGKALPTVKEITTAKSIADVAVTTGDGKTLDQIKTDLGTTVTLLAGNEEVTVPVTWLANTVAAYDNGTAETHVLIGTISTLPAGYIDEITPITTVSMNIVVGDHTAPTLSNVTNTPVTVGQTVSATSNESGYFYLVLY
jgi:hypothetical protein